MKYKSILLIDDDDDDKEIFLAALEKLNKPINCTAFNNANDALVTLEARAKLPDIIFLDLNMPVMNGQQFLRELKKREALRNIPVIVVSTTSNADTILSTKALGANGFITKPSKFNELINVLASILI